jgi:OmpA family
MQTKKRNYNKHWYTTCLTIILLALTLFLPNLGQGSFKTNNSNEKNAGRPNSRQGARYFAGLKLSSPRLHYPVTTNAKKRIKHAGIISYFRKTHTKNKRQVKHTTPPHFDQLFTQLGNAIRMEALPFRINELLPAGENWKEGLDSLIHPYINGMEAYDSILVVGYTDNTGTKEGNLRLSEKRAKNIAAFLVNQGIPATLIHIVAVGQDAPVTTNNSIDGRNTNRRVEINFLKSS